MRPTPIQVQRLGAHQRRAFPKSLFMDRFAFVRSFAEDVAGSLSSDYSACEWRFYRVSADGQQGFFMAPFFRKRYNVELAAGNSFMLSATSFGLVCCISSYRWLSHSPEIQFAAICRHQYDLLLKSASTREEHPDILFAVSY